jgi:predicted nucleic acid-binding protein
VSAQVLAETFRALTQRLAAPLPREIAEAQIHRIRRTWRVLPIHEAIVVEAMRGVREHQLSYWDAQVWATARLRQIPVVLTEDIPSAPEIETVSFENPFDSAFNLDQLN